MKLPGVNPASCLCPDSHEALATLRCDGRESACFKRQTEWAHVCRDYLEDACLAFNSTAAASPLARRA